jgi:opacity protein-like surface antigen
MRKVFILGLALLLLGAVARGQGPVRAGIAPVLEGSIGYTYMQSDVPTMGNMNINGLLLSGNGDFSRRFGVKLELGYSRNFDAFHTGRTADMLTYMGGPVFYPLRYRRFHIYTQALLGGARETGVNIDSNGDLVLGFVNRFAWAAGGGFQYGVTPAFSLRAGADYLRTSFFDSNIVVRGQRNLRTSVSVVYTFGRHE